MIYVKYKYGDPELKVACYRALVNGLTTLSVLSRLPWKKETPSAWSIPSDPKASSHPVDGLSEEVAEDNQFSMGAWNADISP